MNKVILMGRLTRDPNITTSQSGQEPMKIARFTLAVDRRRSSSNSNQGQPTADFISCVVFGRLADFVEGYLHQGTKVVASGRIQTGSYTNKDGQKVYTTDVVLEDIEFAESKSTSSSGDYSAPSRPTPGDAGDGFLNIPDGVEDEGLPFN